MCGRVTLTIDFETLQAILKTKYNIPKPHINPYNPRYNISPGQNLVAVIHDGENYRAGELEWGFIPPFYKDEKMAKKLTNARAESIREKPSFKHSFEQKRCIILVDSYYEWRSTLGEKVPFRVHYKDYSLLSLAGIWSTFIKEDGSKLHTCAIITTDANDIIKPIHHRMPAIISNKHTENWLNTAHQDYAFLSSLLTPYQGTDITLYEVSKLVNNTRFDTQECILPFTNIII